MFMLQNIIMFSSYYHKMWLLRGHLIPLMWWIVFKYMKLSPAHRCISLYRYGFIVNTYLSPYLYAEILMMCLCKHHCLLNELMT